MPYLHDIYKLGTVTSAAVTSAATNSVLISAQTTAVRVCALGAASASAGDNIGAFIAITSPVAAGAVTSANGTFIRVGTPEVFKCGHGSKMVEARGIGAVAFTLYVTELTD